MTKELRHLRFRLLAILMALQMWSGHSEAQKAPYYGFFPSEKGERYKKLVHNILGFSIDMPTDWTFGVNGVPPLAVVFVYPEGLNTGKFSKDYELIEIGKLPLDGLNLEAARKTVMLGMTAKHPKNTILQKPKTIKIAGDPAISWIYQWPSKTGFTITEYITLVRTTSGIRSLTVRTTNPDHDDRSKFFDKILETFSAFTPKHGQAEQGGADQPPPAVDSKTEGGEKAKPDAEGRRR